MNVHRDRPACHTTAPPTPLAPNFHDQGMSCAQGLSAALWVWARRLTPGCAGCSRLRRALDVSAGTVTPLERVPTRPMP